MGRVYRVLDKKLGEEVALKLIKPEIASDEKNDPSASGMSSGPHARSATPTSPGCTTWEKMRAPTTSRWSMCGAKTSRASSAVRAG